MDNRIMPNPTEIKILYPPSGTAEAFTYMISKAKIGTAVLDNRFLYGFSRENIENGVDKPK